MRDDNVIGLEATGNGNFRKKKQNRFSASLKTAL